MQSENAGFLLNSAGGQLALSAVFPPQEISLVPDSDPIGHAITRCGFVLIQQAHHTIFVELCPSKVAPLAALAAFHQIKETRAECVVLASAGDSWRCSQYEIFVPTKEALVRIGRMARSASKRAAAELRSGDPGSPVPKIEA